MFNLNIPRVKEAIKYRGLGNDGMKKKKKHRINREWCKGCGICVEFCPKEVLVLADDGKVKVEDPDKCIACGLCEMRCPDIAIELV